MPGRLRYSVIRRGTRVGHREGDVVTVDALRERKPPFSPEDVVSEFAELLKSYRVTSISGDRYAGEWPKERFRDHGISYEPRRSRSRISIAICCPPSTRARSTCLTI